MIVNMHDILDCVGVSTTHKRLQKCAEFIKEKQNGERNNNKSQQRKLLVNSQFSFVDKSWKNFIVVQLMVSFIFPSKGVTMLLIDLCFD